MFVLDPKVLVGSMSGVALDQLVKRLDVSVRSFETLDLVRLEDEFREVLVPVSLASAALVSAAIRDIIIGTIESIVISRMRMMRWQGLALLGYTFTENRQEVQIAPVQDLAEQRRRIEDIGRRLASSGIFSTEVAWLKAYVTNQLDLMRIELDGAELEAL